MARFHRFGPFESPCRLNKKPDRWAGLDHSPVSERRSPTPVLGSQMPSRSPNVARCRNVPGRPSHTRAPLCLLRTTLYSIAFISSSRTLASCCFRFDWQTKGPGVRSTFSRSMFAWQRSFLDGNLAPIIKPRVGSWVFHWQRTQILSKAEQFGRLAGVPAISPSW